MAYYQKPRKKFSKKAVEKWTRNSRNQDRSNHPFKGRNSVLRTKIVDELDIIEEGQTIPKELYRGGSVDGDKPGQQQILEGIE